MKFSTYITVFILFLALLSCKSTIHNTSKKVENPYSLSDIHQKADILHNINENNFCDFIIVDGVPYDESNIDSLLSRYNREDIEYIQFVKNTFSHKPCKNITVISTKKQSKKEKKIEFSYIKMLLKNEVPDILIRDWNCKSCHLIIINDQSISDPYEQKKIINDLDIKDIKSIYYFQRPLRKDLWGSLADNGVIQIKLKKP